MILPMALIGLSLFAAPVSPFTIVHQASSVSPGEGELPPELFPPLLTTNAAGFAVLLSVSPGSLGTVEVTFRPHVSEWVFNEATDGAIIDFAGQGFGPARLIDSPLIPITLDTTRDYTIFMSGYNSAGIGLQAVGPTIPEPASFMLLLIGGLFASGFKRRGKE